MCDNNKPTEIIRRGNLELRIFYDIDAEHPNDGDRLGSPEEVEAWREGEVYGYEVWKIETCNHCGQNIETLEDSCWGFYGDDHKATGLLECAGFYPLLPIEECYLNR